MVTYPSTHGVFEETINEICEIVHAHGGQVYMDGANMNAQVGLCRPGDIGADVCHLNLHKTFCIPHGGGGPGMGPIGVAEHLVAISARPSVVGESSDRRESDRRRSSAAPWGSASILTISWMYIRMMGGDGLTEATKVAILNANYIAKRLDAYFPVLYKGQRRSRRARMHSRSAAVQERRRVEDVAKRLMDYGFHAPTISWPVAGHDDDRADRERIERRTRSLLRCDDFHPRRNRGDRIGRGRQAKQCLEKRAAHRGADRLRQMGSALFARTGCVPAPWTREHKFWPAVGRIDNVYGDRNLLCSCPPMEDFAG